MTLLLLLNPKESWSAYQGEDLPSRSLKKKRKKKLPQREFDPIPLDSLADGFGAEDGKIQREKQIKKRKKQAKEILILYMMMDEE